MSSFSKFEITGQGALRYLQWLAAGNIDKGEGGVVYTQLLNARGGIEADLTIMYQFERLGVSHSKCRCRSAAEALRLRRHQRRLGVASLPT